jgi:hypothetical protein
LVIQGQIDAQTQKETLQELRRPRAAESRRQESKVPALRRHGRAVLSGPDKKKRFKNYEGRELLNATTAG